MAQVTGENGPTLGCRVVASPAHLAILQQGLDGVGVPSDIVEPDTSSVDSEADENAASLFVEAKFYKPLMTRVAALKGQIPPIQALPQSLLDLLDIANAPKRLKPKPPPARRPSATQDRPSGGGGGVAGSTAKHDRPPGGNAKHGRPPGDGGGSVAASVVRGHGGVDGSTSKHDRDAKHGRPPGDDGGSAPGSVVRSDGGVAGSTAKHDRDAKHGRPPGDDDGGSGPGSVGDGSMSRLPGGPEMLVGADIWGALKPYQRSGVEFVAALEGRAMLSDGMGLGKTAQAIVSTLMYRDKWPVLVVAPSSVRHNLRQEFMHWARLEPSDVVVIHTGDEMCRLFGRGPAPIAPTGKRKSKPQAKPPPSTTTETPNTKRRRKSGSATAAPGYGTKETLRAQVYIVSYDLISRPGLLAAVEQHRFKVLVADESHNAKHMASRRTRCLLQLAWKAHHVILMSGTPGVSPAELYPQMLALQPRLWPPWWKPPKQQIVTHDKMRELNHKLECSFASRWCDPRPQRIAGGRFEYVFNSAIRLDELYAIGRHFCWIQRSKEDVLGDLPPKHRECIRFTVDVKDQKMMEDALENMQTQGATNSLRRKALFSQVYNALPAIKLPFVRQYVDNLFAETGAMGLDPQRKCLLFAHHHSMMAELEAIVKARNIGYIRIAGDTPGKARHALVEKFQTDPACRVAILSITAAGVGINLFAASLVVICELLFGPDVLLQAEDRSHRLGQTLPVDCIYLLASGSLEEMIWRIVQKKQKRSVRMMQDRDGCFTAATRHVEGPSAAPAAPPGADGDNEELLQFIAEAAPPPPPNHDDPDS